MGCRACLLQSLNTSTYVGAALAIEVGEVSSLAHKARDNSMEERLLEVQRAAALAHALLPRAQRAEVLSSLGHHVGAELRTQCQASTRGPLVRSVRRDVWVMMVRSLGHVTHRHLNAPQRGLARGNVEVHNCGKGREHRHPSSAGLRWAVHFQPTRVMRQRSPGLDMAQPFFCFLRRGDGRQTD